MLICCAWSGGRSTIFVVLAAASGVLGCFCAHQTKPLSAANVEVQEVPGKPGVYRAVAFLKPHFQLDELTVSLRLVAELPQGAK